MQGFFGVLSPITLGFIVVICVFGIIFQIRFNRRTADLGPTLLTTTGIFGTFVGIALGLYHFDANKVEDSIPALLEGLKTAFFASVCGVGFAILLKLREFAFGTGRSDELEPTPDDVTAADLARHLRDIRAALVGADDGSLISQMKLARQDGNERLETLRALQRSLSGSEDGSLLTQIRLLRQDSNDRLDALRVAMGEALKKLSEMGSQALIEALRDVIRDFNNRITEQFGENFKQLNIAVGNLLVWQEQYKATVEMTVAKLGDVGRLVGDLAGSFSVMVERSGRFADVADRLGAMLTALESSERRLREQSEALAALLLKASGSLPEIERKIEELSVQMANAVRENQRVVSAALTESATALRGTVEALRKDVATVSSDLSGMVTKNQETVAKALTENATAIRGSLDSVQREMAGTNAEFNRKVEELSVQMANAVRENQRVVSAALTETATALRGTVEALRKDVATVSGDLSGMVTKNQETVAKALTENATAIRGSFDSAQRDMTGINAEFNRQLRELADKTKEQVATLDAALRRELQTALQSLAQQFTAISGQFAKDYGKLADTLKHIIDSTRVGR